MSVLSIQPTFPIFTDIDGQPLDAGYIWIGTENLNPITNPISVFFDAALTQPAVQPIRTVSGYPANAGTPARLYVNSDYSIQVQNKNGTLVYSAADGASDRFSSSQVSFIQAGTGAVSRTSESKMRERVSVLDFGADPTGGLDSTTAFNNALATGKRVFVPKGDYLVADVQLPSFAYVEGEERAATTLIVSTNNSGAFTFSGCFEALVQNLSIRAGSGVTGARAFKQTSKTNYMAYCKFENIETWADLQISYDVWPIFHTWDRCRDGYYGTPPGGQTHQGINAIPDAYGQTNQCNLNQILRCQFFRSSNPNGAIEIHYGVQWKIVETDFELNNCSAAKFLGVYNISFDGCWFEANTATSVIVLGESPAPNPQGCNPVEIANSHAFFNDDATVNYFVFATGAVTYGIRNVFFARIAANTRLSNINPVIAFEGTLALSDLSAGAFLGGFRSTKNNMNIGNSTLLNTVLSSPSMQNINVLPIGPSGLGVANLSDDYNGAVDPAPTDVSSGLGLATDAIEYTLGDNNQWVWYSFNAKMVNFLKGKTITVVINGYGVDALVGDAVFASVWDSVTPTEANRAAFSTNFIDVTNTGLQTAYVTYTVGAAATSLDVGWLNGGNNPNKLMIIETMAVYLGQYVPTLGNLR
jgi:hypothetical protein